MLKKIIGSLFVLTALVYLVSCGASDWKKWTTELDQTVDDYIIAVLNTKDQGDENHVKAQAKLEKLNTMFQDSQKLREAIASSNEQEEFSMRVTVSYIKYLGLKEYFDMMQEQMMQMMGSNGGMMGTNIIGGQP
jgi:major membrane immunogen (membrane-anchored lipoprotein)